MDRHTKKMLKQLESDQPKLRFLAVLELGKSGDTDLIDTLDRVANLDEHPKVRELATKAVHTLETLQKRRLTRQHVAQEIKEEGEDAGVEWPELMKEKMMEERRLTAAEDLEEFNYIDSKRKELERQKAKAAEREAERQAQLAKIRARNRRFRMLIWVFVAAAVVGLVVLAWYITSVEPPPSTREAALIDLRDWAREQQAAAEVYQKEYDQDPMNCATLQAVATPARPKWTELLSFSELEQEPKEGFLNRMADRMNKINEELLAPELMEPILNNLARANIRLTEIQNNVNAACSSELVEIPQIAWANHSQDVGLIIQAFNSATNAASEIDTELIALQQPE